MCKFRITTHSGKIVNFELCDWDDYGYHYRWNLLIGDENIGSYVLIPFNCNGELVLADKIKNIDLSNEDECNKYTFIGRALNKKCYFSLFEKLGEKEAEKFLEYINDIVFSPNVMITDKKFKNLEKETDQEPFFLIGDIKFSNSSSLSNKKLSQKADSKHDVIEGCLFRNKNLQRIKINNLLGRNVFESYDTKLTLLFVYKSYLLKKDIKQSDILNLIENIFFEKENIADSVEKFINSDKMKQLILTDNTFRKLNYETVLFNLIKKDRNPSKDLFNNFVLYCFDNSFQEGKNFLIDHKLLKKENQEKIEKIQKISKEIKNLLLLNEKNDLPLLCTYTDVQSIKKIYQSKAYYLSEIHQMNDPLESRVFESFTSQKLYNSLRYYNIDTFVMSLTDRIDYLPMWNTYGNDCEGVCCVFDENFLNEFINNNQIFKICYIKRVPNNMLDIFREFINFLLIYNNGDEIEKRGEVQKLEKNLNQNNVQDCLNLLMKKIKNTVIVEKVSGNDQKYKKKVEYDKELERVRSLMINHIKTRKNSEMDKVFEGLNKINELLEVFYDNERKDSNEDSEKDVTITISQKLNDISDILNNSEDSFSIEGMQIAMVEIVRNLGAILKFEDYSYEHEYRILEENISSMQIEQDTKDFEERICDSKNVVKYKLDFSDDKYGIFSSLIFGPKLQYDMIYPRFEIEWDKPNILLQKSEIHYR